MWSKLFLIIIAVVGTVFGIAALQPADFRIQREATINAPPETVFEQVNNLHHWEAWSPWAKKDPNMKQTYEGPEAGAGASVSWKGNREVGEGRMTITESQAPRLILIKLEFLKPMAATSTTEFTFKPVPEQTEVNWSMSGRNSLISRVFCLFMNMEKMVGGDFEKGLAQIKTVAEAKK